MGTGGATAAASVDDPWQARHGGADWLSLALIDARNHTLRWLAAFEAAGDLSPLAEAGLASPFVFAGRAAWWQEWWIVRHVHAQRGEAGDASRPRLASLEPRADDWFGPGATAPLPAPDAVRGYLAQTLDAVLELLAGAAADDDALYFHRLALWREDRLAEVFADAAQALGRPLDGAPAAAPPARPERAPLWFPAQRTVLGAPRGGLVPAAERWAHEVAVPEFEIDAQPVGWARYAEFAEDGGYDEQRCWSDDGWAWLQAQRDPGRRAPRYVEQLRGGVVVQRAGRLQRVPGQQSAAHVTRHEAEAWCRWAGRRLPTEVEWELAAKKGGSRGFVWGDVFEWTGGRARPWPGCAPAPGFDDEDLPDDADRPVRGVLRGAACSGRARQRQPTARRFASLDADLGASGFRSCAT